MRKIIVAWLTVGAVFLSHQALAQSLQAARAAYDEGRFLEASELAQAIGTSEALTLANLSLVMHGFYIAPDDEQGEFFQRAIDLGERALRLDPSSPENLIRLGQAIGRYAVTLKAMKAIRGGYAGKIRKMFEEALALDPDNAIAHIGLAAWHAEMIEAAGFMARAMFGASKKRARTHYERAFELDPESKQVVFEYASGLLTLNERKNRDRARRLYNRVLEMPSVTAIDGFLDERATKKLAEIDG